MCKRSKKGANKIVIKKTKNIFANSLNNTRHVEYYTQLIILNRFVLLLT